MKKAKILIVDDEYSFAQFAKIILESNGYDVIISLEPAKAAALAEEEHPDLILMDMIMRDQTGTDILKLLKGNPQTKDIPVVICSITKDQTEVQEVFEHGAVDFLPKPLKRELLAEQINRILSGARRP